MEQEKEEFQLRLDLKSNEPEVSDYLDSLHKYLLEWDASSIKQMLVTLDETALMITEDLRMINRGEAYTPAHTVRTPDGKEFIFPEVSKLKVLNDDKKSATYERVMALVGKVDDFKKVCDMAEAIRPTIKKEEVVKEELKIDTTSNVFEQLQEKHYKKNKTK